MALFVFKKMYKKNHTDTETDRHGDAITDQAQRAESVKMLSVILATI